jgi:GTP-binding protein Era
LAINKADRVRKELILPQIDEAHGLYPFREIFPISAKKGDNVAALLGAVTQALPEGPALYPTDEVTDRSVRDLAKDLIREKVLLFTHEEIPHGVAVVIEEWRPGQQTKAKPVSDTEKPVSDTKTYVRAVIYVERESQKGIMIGKQGGLLKKIGAAARREIETLTEGSVYLDLWVKVARNWRKDPLMLRRLGYGG